MVSKIFSFFVFMISIQNVNYTVYQLKMKNIDTKMNIFAGSRRPHFLDYTIFCFNESSFISKLISIQEKTWNPLFSRKQSFCWGGEIISPEKQSILLFFQILILDFISKSENNWHKEIHFQVYHEKASLSETIRRKNEKKNHSFWV